MGNNLLPARLGELLRAHCAAVKTDDDRGRTTALASIAAERILDGTVLAVFGLLSLLLVSVDARLELVLFIVSGIFLGLGSALILGIRHHDRIRWAISAARRRFPGHMTAFGEEKVTQFLDGFLPLGTVRRMSGALALTAMIWSIEVAYLLCRWALGWPGDRSPCGRAAPRRDQLRVARSVYDGRDWNDRGHVAGVLHRRRRGAVSGARNVLLQHAGQYLFTTISGGALYLLGGFYRIPLAQPKTALQPLPSSVASPAANEWAVLEETRARLGQFGASLKPGRRADVQLSIVIPAYNEQSRFRVLC